MKDSFGREIDYLRVSVTQRCNLNCVYCGKEDCEKKDSELPAEDLIKIIKCFAELGIRKVRLTGGEPLVRKDICEIAAEIRKIPGIETMALTTNGVHLKKYARELAHAGIDSVNVSLDSTDDSLYRKLTGSDVLSKVTDGIKEIQNEGISEIKINAVLIRGINDGEAGGLVEIAKNEPIDVRFIELMPFSDAGENRNKIVTTGELLERFPFLEPDEVNEKSTARYYTAPGFIGRVGFISPVSKKFCSECSRIRLLCDGSVKPCLAYDTVYSLLQYIDDREKLKEKIIEIIMKKPAGHDFGFGSKAHGLNRTGG